MKPSQEQGIPIPLSRLVDELEKDYVSLNGSLTPRLTGEKRFDENEFDNELNTYACNRGYYSMFLYVAFRSETSKERIQKVDDAGNILSYELKNLKIFKDGLPDYNEEEWNKVAKLLAKFLDGKMDFDGWDGSQWITRSLILKDGVVKELSPTKTPTKTETMKIILDKDAVQPMATHISENNINLNLYKTQETLTQEHANRIFELKEKANKLDVRGWSCESENIRMGYAPDPANTTKFIPCNIFRNNAFGVYILADYNGDTLLHNANNLITKELRDFMKIEGEMKKVMDDPEYGKDKELLNDKESYNAEGFLNRVVHNNDIKDYALQMMKSENPDKDKVFSFQGEEISDDDSQRDTEYDWLDDLEDDLEQK